MIRVLKHKERKWMITERLAALTALALSLAGLLLLPVFALVVIVVRTVLRIKRWRRDNNNSRGEGAA